LSQLEKRLREMDLESRITTQVADMHALPFVAETFDLIWSEGAI
jgi:hypothetical protein